MTSLTQPFGIDSDRMIRSFHNDNAALPRRWPNPGFLIMSFLFLTIILMQTGCFTSGTSRLPDVSENSENNPAWLEDMVNDHESQPAWVNEVQNNSISENLSHNALDLPINRVDNNVKMYDPSKPLSSIVQQPDTAAETTQGTDETAHHHGGQHNAQSVNIVINQGEEKEKETKRIKREMSRLEALYNKYGLSRDLSLRQYGYEFFQRPEPRVTPKTKIKNSETDQDNKATDTSHIPLGPVSPDYILGPGDEIILKVTGAFQLNERLVIDREAQLFIPKVGQLSLLATPYSDLRSKIQTLVDQKYRNSNVEVSLGRLHLIQIMIVGKLKQPGIKSVPANATLMDALLIAGGPSLDGSLRHITLQRRGQDDQIIDLYEWFNNSERPKDIPLLSGDMIRVKEIGRTVAIIGPTHEGIYEFKQNEDIASLLKHAGYSERFTHTKAVLETQQNPGQRVIERIQLNEVNLAKALSDGDVLKLEFADSRVNNTVEIQGPVLRPAMYPWNNGMKISQLLKEGEGFLINASLSRALLIRRVGQSSKYDVAPGDQRGETQSEMIWIDLAAVLSGDPTADLELQRMDTLKIMTKEETQEKATVTIMGAVRRPGTYELTSGMTLNDLIQLAGGPTRNAYAGLNNILRSSTRNNMRQLDVSLIPFNLKQTLNLKQPAITLKNKDQIVIRRMQSLQVKVTIKGRVQFPGTYVLPDGYTIADALSAAGGLMKDADLRAAIFTRERIRDLQTQRIEHLDDQQKERFSRVRDMVTRDGRFSEAVANDLSMMGLNRLKRNMLRYQSLGRIVIDMTTDDFPKRRDNLTLESGDHLIIPRRSQTVLVMGRVFNPNAFVWKDDWTVADYLSRAGGLKDDADQDCLYIMLANGEVRSLGNRDHQIALNDYVPQPGDCILAPQEALGRSELHMLNDGLLILRQLVEIGAIGASIPKMGTPNVDISSQSTTNNSGYDAAAYQSLLQRQMFRP